MQPRLHFSNPWEEKADRLGIALIRSEDYNLLKFPSNAQIQYSSELNLLLNAAGRICCAELLRPIQEIAIILTLSWYGNDYLIGFTLFSSLAITSSTFATAVVNATEGLMMNSQNAKKPQLTFSWLQIGLCVATVFLVPISATWWFSEPILKFIGFESYYSHLASVYGRLFIPTAVADVWCSFIYRYVVIHKQVSAFLIAEAAFSIILVFVLIVSIWGAGQFKGWGFEGAAYARIFYAWLRFFFYFLYARTLQPDLHLDEIELFSSEYWSYAALCRSLQVSFRSAVSMSLSQWLLPVFMIVAALHDIQLLTPMIILEMVVFLFFSISQGVSTAIGVRVGYFLRTGLAHHAYTTWKAAFTIIIPVAVSSGILTLYLLPLTAPLFSDNSDVRSSVKDCKYLLAGVITLISFACTYTSILFQEGHSPVIAGITWLSSWAIGLPLCIVCILHFSLELHSFWIALSIKLITDVVILGPIVLCTDWQSIAEKCRLKQAQIARAKGATNAPETGNEKQPLSGLTENLLAQNYNAIVSTEPRNVTISESSVEDLRVERPDFSVKAKQHEERITPDEKLLSQSLDSASTVEDLCVRRPDFSVMGRNIASRQRPV